jgi:hypothetical protein
MSRTCFISDDVPNPPLPAPPTHRRIVPTLAPRGPQVRPEDTLLLSVWDQETSGFGASLVGEFRLQARADVIERGARTNQTTVTRTEWIPLHEDGFGIIGKFGSVTKLHCAVSYIHGSLAELKQRPPGLTSEFTLVHVRVLEAAHLPKMDRGALGSVDPYCVLLLGDEQKFRTRTCKQTYSPVWDESFVLVADPGLGGEVLLQMFDWWTSPPRHPSRSASITQ